MPETREQKGTEEKCEKLSGMYIDDRKTCCKTLHHQTAVEIRAGIDYKIRELEADQRRQIPAFEWVVN